MQIGTAVFHRIVQEAEQRGATIERQAAIKALCRTMAETVRFGCFGPETHLPIAESRIDSWKGGQGW
jgi:hypothetical protein